MTSQRWAQFWALLFGLSIGLLWCGTGRAQTVYLPAGVSPEENVTMIQVDRDGYVITHERVCVNDLAAVLQEREDVDTLQRRVNGFYRTAVVDEDGSCVNCLAISSGTGWIQSRVRLGTDYIVTPEGYLLYEPERPQYDPETERVVKKTEEELYQEQKAKILAQITELDRERSRKKEQAKRDAQYERMKDQLEEAKGHLIVSWDTVKRRCVR